MQQLKYSTATILDVTDDTITVNINSLAFDRWTCRGSPGTLVAERAHVTVIDGPACGDGGTGAFRLNFATPQPILAEMVERIAGA